jgi:hypothetical protein
MVTHNDSIYHRISQADDDHDVQGGANAANHEKIKSLRFRMYALGLVLIVSIASNIALSVRSISKVSDMRNCKSSYGAPHAFSNCVSKLTFLSGNQWL